MSQQIKTKLTPLPIAKYVGFVILNERSIGRIYAIGKEHYLLPVRYDGARLNLHHDDILHITSKTGAFGFLSDLEFSGKEVSQSIRETIIKWAQFRLRQHFALKRIHFVKEHPYYPNQPKTKLKALAPKSG